MRRKGLAVVALTLVVAFVVPHGDVTARKGRKRTTCDIAPFSYTVTSSQIETSEDGRQLLRYTANGTTTLSCPEGHRWNGIFFTIRIIDATLSFVTRSQSHSSDFGNALGERDGRILGGYVVSVLIEEIAIPSYEGTVHGSSSPDGSGGYTLDLNIAGRSSDGTRLRLSEVLSFGGWITGSDGGVSELRVADGAITAPKLATSE
jgi:hypothetical protein